jgi:hypothetical protein
MCGVCVLLAPLCLPAATLGISLYASVAFTHFLTAAAYPPCCPPLCSAPCTRRYRLEFREAEKRNEQLSACLGKVADDLHPVRVRQLFAAIPAEVRRCLICLEERKSGAVRGD